MKSEDSPTKSIGSRTNFSDYCGPTRKKLNPFKSRIVETAYNTFIEEDMKDFCFDWKQVVLLRF